MIINKTTDGKYVGLELEINIKQGSTLVIGDFEFFVQKLNVLEDGKICASNPNYQIIFEE